MWSLSYSVKDRGGLLYPSGDILKILKTYEVAFKTVVSGKDFLHYFLK